MAVLERFDPGGLIAAETRVESRRGVHAWSRRRFLRASVATAGALVFGVGWSPGLAPLTAGKFLGLIPFDDEQVAPAGTLTGSELDGRLFTDLARVPDRPITPREEFFVRSAASRLLPPPAGWTIAFEGEGEGEGVPALPAEALRKGARPMGVHLMECAGNVARTRFGLISAAEWSGVPMTDILGEAKAPAAAWVEIAGFDDYSEGSRTSIPGASWIFPREWLKQAFLATQMNGAPLAADHGAPVRLVIPGWYGAACIKWVNRIRFVEENAQASSQMVEYAVRTLQAGKPQLARDYAPATVDPAALPVRVEKWAVGGKISYRVVGLAWGGPRTIDGLRIRFNPDAQVEVVEGFRARKEDTWSVWTHAWTPASPGNYQIRMAVNAPGGPARKVDMGLYDRTVHIGEV